MSDEEYVPALIDGERVDGKALDPKIHRYLGQFRYPYGVVFQGLRCFVRCPCGQTLQSNIDRRKHWDEGHFDLPQYVTIIKE